ncbi:M3 family metallopeptidase [Sphingomonas sp. CGMCC 1.13654]|uniref:M3 family metallopeptidase n=1 Tax=Sphingomonas chungangi TaxID=2683589 RepID=A0A838L8X0_9SPHN|nr:M3 family metallopeptidase [Sphingomonas chungangi]MBA2934969.1 M3 family metallopeptidase [Sphingomonas chungangi]MVW58279.1 M3 family peptidase [Sphingomonas chungangi]
MIKKLMLGAASAGLIVGAAHAATPAAPANPLLAPWTGPYGGEPAFNTYSVAQFEPALTAAMAMDQKEIDAIANNPAHPTFANTILALEKSGEALNRVYALYGIWEGNLNTPDFQAVDTKMSPILQGFQDKITQNAKLFARIDTVYNSPDKAKLTPEQQRLVWVTWNNFAQQGARLSPADKAKLADVNQQLASLQTKFAQNELADEENYALTLTKDQLGGLPDAQIEGYAEDAKGHKLPAGQYRIANTRSAVEPFLTYSSDRALREKAFRMWTSRGDMGNANDNNAIVVQILKLRTRKANLLGYKTYADWHLADTMAKKPQAALDLEMAMFVPAVAQVHKDVAEMQKIVDAEHGGFKIAPWDYRYYAEKVRKAKYDLDLNEVKPYLQLDHVREAMFYAANRLYGFTFTKVEGLPVFQPDVTVYEVKRNGQHVGLWYFDPYARAGKNSGAWMNAWREQSRVDGDVPTIVSNNANFVKGTPGQPVLISWDDADTMFHEFGHALHGLNSNVTYRSLSGTNTDRDFVEFPSQFNEHYLMTPEVLHFLVNARGEQMPAELVAKIKKAATFNTAFSVVETEASAIVDMKLHLAGDTVTDPKAFEKTTLAEIDMPSEIVMRHRIPQFGHIFSGEGYAAGYYGYLWAKTLDNDAFEAFTEAGSPWDPATAKRFQTDILSVGNTIDPAIAYRNFRGRDATIDATLREDGFPVPAKK